MYKKKVIGLICLLIFTFLLIPKETFAIEPGDPIPKIRVSVWLRNKPVGFLKKWKANENEDYLVICFWATWSNTVNNLFRFLENESSLYGHDGVQFIAISKENRRIVERFLNKIGKINFSVAVDRKAKTYRDFMHNTSGVPVFFIFGKDKKLIWKGSPFEFDRVLSRVVTGTYDPEKERKIKDLRDELQRSIEFMNFNRQAEISKQILEIDPLDQIAINNIADDYIRDGEIDKSIEFMFERIKMAAHNKYISRSLYFNLLTIFQGMNNEKGQKYLEKATDGFYAATKNDPDGINAYVSTVIQAMPMEIVPIKKMHEMMNNAIELHNKLYKDKTGLLGIYYRTLAKVYYMAGCINQAIEYQTKSVDCLKNVGRENLYNSVCFTLDYYKRIKDIYKEFTSRQNDKDTAK